MATLHIGIVGDFDLRRPGHWATEAALFHAASSLKVEVAPHWVATASLGADSARSALTQFDGIWAAPGSPYVSAEGMLRAIQFARSGGVPFLGTCGGFQYALIEFTRSVLGLADATTAEDAAASENIVITPVVCEVPVPGSPRLCGAESVRTAPGSLLHELCGPELAGEYFCSFECNRAFEERWQRAGLAIVGRGPAGEMRALEIPQHPFFVGTLFQPQLASSFARSHPIINGFLRAAQGARRAR